MKIFVLIFVFVPILIGLILIFGVKRKWHYLLHPPDHIWIFPLYPYAFMKGDRFNERFFVKYHLIGGFVSVFVGITFFILVLVYYC